MQPVMQTVLHGDGKAGNCVQACVASLLELPLSAVPHFFEPLGETFHEATDQAVADCWRGFFGFFDRFGLHATWVAAKANSAHGFPHIVGGPGPRGVEHCVIRDGFEIVHDPHPSGDGLLKVSEVLELSIVDFNKLEELGRLRSRVTEEATDAT